MRLHFLSDLHLEFAPFDVPQVEADVTVIAGDVHTGSNGMKWIFQHLPNRPVIYVLGNHEFYGQTVEKLLNKLTEMTKGTNVHLLDNGAATVEDVTFLGATLWTDLGLYGASVAAATVVQTGMTDYRKIRTLPHYGRLRAADTRRMHLVSRSWPLSGE